MITKEILESHPVTILKKELSKTNIKGYSKMKKSEVVALMLKPEHAKRFSHIVKKGEAPKPEKKIVIKRTPKPEKKIVIKRTPKPEKKIVIKRTPKPEKKIVIKRTPAKKIKIIKDKKEPVKKNVIKTEKEFIKGWKDLNKTLAFPSNDTDEDYKSFYKLYLKKEKAKEPEKKIVIKRTPKPAAPKPEKKIVIKKPRKETPGSIEAKRIKKRIKIEKEKAPAKKRNSSPIGDILELNKSWKGKSINEMMKAQPEINKRIKEKVDELAKAEGYKGMTIDKNVNRLSLLTSFLGKVQYPNRYTSEAHRDINLKIFKEGLNYGNKIQQKIQKEINKIKQGKPPAPAPAPAPAKKKMLSPLEDIRSYLNNVNSKEYKMLREGKEPKKGEKNWYQVLKEKLNKVMDSDIPYNIDNLFTYKKLMEFKTLKDIPRKELVKEDDVMGESINSAIQDIFTINKQKRDFGGELTLSELKRDRDREANKEIAVKREGLSKVKEIIKINKRREELCTLYSDKRYKNYESAEKKKERNEKIKKLSKELKDILKTFKTNLYFNSVICTLEDLPKGLYQMLNEKLATKGNKSTADSVGKINELKFIARKVFKVDLKSLEN